MEGIIRETSIKMLKLLNESLERDNLSRSFEFGTRITDVSVTLDSKIGVMIGETVESSLMQMYDETVRFEIGPEEYAKEIRDLVALVDSLADAINTDEEGRVYSALLEIRFHVTKRQYSMLCEYKRRRPGRFR